MIHLPSEPLIFFLRVFSVEIIQLVFVDPLVVQQDFLQPIVRFYYPEFDVDQGVIRSPLDHLLLLDVAHVSGSLVAVYFSLEMPGMLDRLFRKFTPSFQRISQVKNRGQRIGLPQVVEQHFLADSH